MVIGYRRMGGGPGPGPRAGEEGLWAYVVGLGRRGYRSGAVGTRVPLDLQAGRRAVRLGVVDSS